MMSSYYYLIPLLRCGAIICAIAIAIAIAIIIAILVSVNRQDGALPHCRMEDVLKWRRRLACLLTQFSTLLENVSKYMNSKQHYLS